MALARSASLERCRGLVLTEYKAPLQTGGAGSPMKAALAEKPAASRVLEAVLKRMQAKRRIVKSPDAGTFKERMAANCRQPQSIQVRKLHGK